MRIAVARLDRLAHALEVGEEAVEHLEHGVAVVEEHVAPHRRVARGDAGEVAEAAGRILDHFALRDLLEVGGGADDGVGDQVREVAGDRENEVVVLGVHHLDHRPERAPELGKLGDAARDRRRQAG